jgi:hypothetical protein
MTYWTTLIGPFSGFSADRDLDLLDLFLGEIALHIKTGTTFILSVMRCEKL